MSRAWRVGCLVVFGVVVLTCLGGGALLATVMGGAKALEPGPLADTPVNIVTDGFAAIYVVPAGPEQVVLIDAGIDPEAPSIREALTSMGNPEVLAILLTHGHGDHYGGAASFPGVPLMIGRADEKLVRGEEAPESPWGRISGASPTGLEPTRLLDDGDVVQLGELSVEVLALPGHTPGSVAYLAEGVLFLGDSAGATSTDELTSSITFFSSDVEQNVASLRALAVRLAPRAHEVRYMVWASGTAGGARCARAVGRAAVMHS